MARSWWKIAAGVGLIAGATVLEGTGIGVPLGVAADVAGASLISSGWNNDEEEED